ncbi:MAG: acetate--CoA ligase [Candidatus Thermoplasmatota archaeon]|nr:acetate--CoA ligase [Candidatus Thermoplasmatota archaeon]
MEHREYDEWYKKSIESRDEFWDKIARELDWFELWDKVWEWNEPFARWFVGAKCNIAYNILERNATTWRKNKLAIIWEGENGEIRTLSYYQLAQECEKLAAVLKSFGIRKGDRVTIYLPRIPEQIISMLTCAKIGAVQNFVYCGLSLEALSERISDSQSKILITTDGSYMHGRTVELKKIADEALSRSPTIEACIVVRRIGEKMIVNMEPGRDYWYHELMALRLANEVKTEVMDAEDPLFILYTSGTTGKPKGVVHAHGGYMIGTYITTKVDFDLKEEDTYWCTGDAGWITGHSYVVYGPLLNGATEIIYEGAVNHPYPDRWWSIIERYGVSIFYTTPTAIRGLMRFGDAWPRRHNLSSLRILGTVGEPINPAAWDWLYAVVGGGRCPIVDTYWQTETGMHTITTIPGMKMKPGWAGKPFFGIEPLVVDDKGKTVRAQEIGHLVLKPSWPSMLRGLYNDPERYREKYWTTIPGYYYTGDAAKIDEEGYMQIIGREDDVIKVSGYRLGSAEIESAIASHPEVTEAAVIPKPDELKGNVIKAFVTLKQGVEPSNELKQEIIEHVAHELGSIAKPSEIEFVESLPKTRSGKIMRRLLRAKEAGTEAGDLSTLEQ